MRRAYNTRSSAPLPSPALKSNVQQEKAQNEKQQPASFKATDDIVTDITAHDGVMGLTMDDPPAVSSPHVADRHPNGPRSETSILDLIGPGEPLELILHYLDSLQDR